jgi:hypothetical protein
MALTITLTDTLPPTSLRRYPFEVLLWRLNKRAGIGKQANPLSHPCTEFKEDLN